MLENDKRELTEANEKLKERSSVNEDMIKRSDAEIRALKKRIDK